MIKYEERDIEGLGRHYLRHVEAMTAEGLSSKSDIAAELAFRDSVVSRLYRIIMDCRDEAKSCDKDHQCYKWTNNCILNLTRLSPDLEDAAEAAAKD